MEIKTLILVNVCYEGNRQVEFYFDDVNKAAQYQLHVMNANNVLSAELSMNMKKDNEYHD